MKRRKTSRKKRAEICAKVAIEARYLWPEMECDHEMRYTVWIGIGVFYCDLCGLSF